MRYGILILLSVMFLMGCRSKVTTNESDDGGGNPPPPPPAQDSIPKMPGNLRLADVHVGVGFTVMWNDSNNNETGFVLNHGLAGQTSYYDTLRPNVTQFTEEAGTVEGTYTFRIQTLKDTLHSAWTTQLSVNYKLESNGLIPLRVGNWWEYHVDSAGTTRDFRRSVHEMRLLNGLDYYLLADSSLEGDVAHGQFFLRNTSYGISHVSFPADTVILADTLFRYPNINAGQWDTYEGDSVWILTSASGTSGVHVGGSTYNHVVEYQRFYHQFYHPGRDANNSIVYYLIPDSIGLIGETERVNGESTQRYITARHVEN